VQAINFKIKWFYGLKQEKKKVDVKI